MVSVLARTRRPLSAAIAFSSLPRSIAPAETQRALDPRDRPEFLHLWSGFYYGELAAQELSACLAKLAPDPQLRRYSHDVHHADEAWHAEVFADLIAQLPSSPAIPPPPDWAEELRDRIHSCTDSLDLVVGSMVVEASALFLLDLQAEFPGSLGHIFRRIRQQEHGHVTFARHYLRSVLAESSPERARQVRSQLFDTFRHMRDRIRPQFVALHLNPVLPLLGISAQDYRDRARRASQQLIRDILR
ncbi:MAG: hypothetical protein AAFX40_04745 [Cyanobacteria bacterium J06639_1]